MDWTLVVLGVFGFLAVSVFVLGVLFETGCIELKPAYYAYSTHKFMVLVMYLYLLGLVVAQVWVAERDFLADALGRMVMRVFLCNLLGPSILVFTALFVVHLKRRAIAENNAHRTFGLLWLNWLNWGFLVFSIIYDTTLTCRNDICIYTFTQTKVQVSENASGLYSDLAMVLNRIGSPILATINSAAVLGMYRQLWDSEVYHRNTQTAVEVGDLRLVNGRTLGRVKVRSCCTWIPALLHTATIFLGTCLVIFRDPSDNPVCFDRKGIFWVWIVLLAAGLVASYGGMLAYMCKLYSTGCHRVRSAPRPPLRAESDEDEPLGENQELVSQQQHVPTPWNAPVSEEASSSSSSASGSIPVVAAAAAAAAAAAPSGPSPAILMRTRQLVESSGVLGPALPGSAAARVLAVDATPPAAAAAGSPVAPPPAST